MFPLFLNLDGCLCLVVGGGPVGLRKAAALHRAGARVRLVCLEPAPPDTSFGLDWLTTPYHPEHLDGARLAVTAASAEVNRQVVADARARGVWVNSATGPESGDAFFPAALKRGDLTIAVGTGGHAPALARQIRDRLEGQFDDTFGLWVSLLAELRPLVRTLVPAGQRRALLEQLCDWDWLMWLRREGIESVRAAMRAKILALAQGLQPPP